MATIIEWGHFYSNIWMTNDAWKWWDTIKTFKKEKDASMLFIDDVHKESQFEIWKWIIPIKIDFSGVINELSDYAKDIITEINKNLKVTIDQEEKIIKPDYLYFEWDMKEYTEKILDILFQLSRKKCARKKENWEIFCSGWKIIQSYWTPTCTWYDLWLTYLKDKELWFNNAINILPKEYEWMQDLLNKIYKKINSDFSLEQFYI